MAEDTSQKNLTVVILAAGYGTRLEADLRRFGSSEQINLNHLIGVPKALLPLGGKLLLTHWIEILRELSEHLANIFIVTNNKMSPMFKNWARINNFPEENIFNDGTDSNETRLGALEDLSFTLKQGRVKDNDLLVIAGDTLFYRDDPNANLSNLYEGFLNYKLDTILCYQLQNEADVSKHGIVEVDSNRYVTKFLEKPRPSETTSRFACPAFYLFKKESLSLLDEFLAEKSGSPLQERDAPGNFVAWLISKVKVKAREIRGRFDIGNLEHYKEAEMHFAAKSENFKLIDTLRKEQIVCRSYARIGLLGNPSDGFSGKTISFTIKNFWAQVVLWESEKLEIIPHPKHDRLCFNNLADLETSVQQETYHGGIRLLKATCKKFFHYCKESKLVPESALKKAFTIQYYTNIPRQVGLGGSSAIVSACFKCLMNFFGLTNHDIPKATMACHILAVEQEELGINAGLQDRVIQVYEGLVSMDFTGKNVTENRYESMDVGLLPQFFLALIPHPSDSGVIHSNVKQRWLDGDQVVRAAMQEFASYAEQGKKALLERDYKTLGELMDKNFDLRRKTYGDTVLGKHNLRMIHIARSNGAYAKFPGSGGAIVGLCRPETSIEKLAQAFAAEGYLFVQVQVKPAS